MALRIFWSKRAETNFEKITAYLQEVLAMRLLKSR